MPTRAILILLFTAVCAPAAATPPQPPEVPIDELIQACYFHIHATPKDPRPYYTLARLYSLGFAVNKANVGGVNAGYAHGPLPTFMPGDLGKYDFKKSLVKARPYHRLLPRDEVGKRYPRLKPLGPGMRHRVDGMIRSLDDPSPKRRRAAFALLKALGPTVHGHLFDLAARKKGLTPRQLASVNTLVDETQWCSWLNKSIHFYLVTIKLQPRHPRALLGLAWACEALERRAKAIEFYRGAFKYAAPEALKKGKRVKGIVGEATLAREAATRLLALLPEGIEEAREREQLTRVVAAIDKLPVEAGKVSPIVVPLGRSIRYASLLSKRTARFDLLGDGVANRWQWVTADAGLLVWDPRHRGRVRDGMRLFGHGTWGVLWDHGYQPLALLDRDHDGWLSGRELDRLAIWRDAGAAGVAERGEVTPLRAHGITKLAVHPAPRLLRGEVYWAPEGAVFRDGRVRPTYDWLATPASQSGPRSR